ncbi:hypothetical protein RDB90_003222 [Salmonella enterica]|nr:hypothetical protein [Salmonella enterica]EEI9431064.1 hypothetical protein [Salmonella enterica subsp. diarizonae]EAV3686538.1 hypothetical protein [Salmonella enterica]EBG6880259.1 hypothetical protein [Salmonella enterica]EBG9219379.1 hypothetical protein [Salmonella enterica]
MKLSERWTLYVKWFVVWLVVQPAILNRVERCVRFRVGLCDSRWLCVWFLCPAGGSCVFLPLPALEAVRAFNVAPW